MSVTSWCESLVGIAVLSAFCIPVYCLAGLWIEAALHGAALVGAVAGIARLSSKGGAA